MRLIIALLLIPIFAYSQPAKLRVGGKVGVVKFGDKAYFANFIRNRIPPTPIDTGDFDVIYRMDWENTAFGEYSIQQQQIDWNGGNYEWGLHEDLTRGGVWNYWKDCVIMSSGEPANPSKFMRSTFKQSMTGVASGFSWEGELGTMYDEVYLTYRVRFKPGFEVTDGGKFPGLGGGNLNTGVFYCDLPLNDPIRINAGFDGVAVWNNQFLIDSYIYHHNCVNNSGGWAEGGAWSNDSQITLGNWFTITIRLVNNSYVGGTYGADGIMEAFVNGKLVFQRNHYKWRENPNLGIHKIIFHSFVGGQNPGYETTSDQWADWDDIIVWKYAAGVTGVPRGLEYTAPGTTITLPVQY
jgi:hypothetical protein